MDQTPEFLQSEEWLAFQVATDKTVVRCSSDNFLSNGIVHRLPCVGKYLYVPRGPIVGSGNQESGIKHGMRELLEKARVEQAGWIRIEPEAETLLVEIRKAVPYRVIKASHDMQPREIFVIDIAKSEAALLAAMKPKTRYNIRLAEKRGVRVFTTRDEKYQQIFLALIEATADRKEIVPHPRSHYEHLFTAFPEGMCQLFVAEYAGRVIAANLLVVFEGRAIYLHGGSSNEHRDAMAPYLLQWEQIKYAKERGCTEYDFGGVKTRMNQESGIRKDGRNGWKGITRFKSGFAPSTQPIVFPGSYDMILDSRAYFLYTFLRRLQAIIRSLNIFS
ncbi:MAG: peptidoglycan bridge formation glycyltransferase FemA/FemB family protein [Candidatus Moraniibacteriota bacterium]